MKSTLENFLVREINYEINTTKKNLISYDESLIKIFIHIQLHIFFKH